jgi:hypothetical protein
MALVDDDHVPVLAAGFVTVLVASILALAALNHFADHY